MLSIRARTSGALGLLLASGLPVLAQSTTRVSVDSSGAQGIAFSIGPSISADGHYLAFWSPASNLVSADTNGWEDVFVRDLQAGTTERVSVSSSGVEGDDYSGQPAAISADGRFVAFLSFATNLVPNDTNNLPDVFLRDRQAGTTERISVSSTGMEANASGPPSISADGRYVAFQSGASNLPDGSPFGYPRVYVRDRQTGQTQHVPFATFSSNAYQSNPRISDDGRFVAFEEAGQVYLHDFQSGVAELVSLAGGQPGNGTSVVGDLSPDGRFVAFWSYAPNLVPGDQNGSVDVFVRDRQAGGTTRVSVSSTGSEGNYDSYGGAISADGRFVAFESSATNLVAGDTNGTYDIVVRDRQSGTTERVSLDSGGTQGNDGSGGPSISADGRFVAFDSSATNLVAGDTNALRDVFLRDRGVPPPATYCTAKVNSLGCTPTMGWSGTPSLSGPDDFQVTASNVRNRKLGIMFWSGASASVPLYGGTRCVASPIIRTHGQNSGGTPTVNDCSGTYSFAFSHAYMASYFLTTGSTIYAQYWSRDPGFPTPNNIGLTNGLEFVIGP